jgi:hypothetical protein
MSYVNGAAPSARGTPDRRIFAAGSFAVRAGVRARVSQFWRSKGSRYAADPVRTDHAALGGRRPNSYFSSAGPSSAPGVAGVGVVELAAAAERGKGAFGRGGVWRSSQGGSCGTCSHACAGDVGDGRSSGPGRSSSLTGVSNSASASTSLAAVFTRARAITNLVLRKAVLRRALEQGLIRSAAGDGGGLCLNLSRIIVVGWSGRWPRAG